MLRKTRIALAVIFLLGISLLFIIPAQEYHRAFGWMAKLQFLPAVMAVNVAIIAGILLLTLAFGRIYCSVICPLGVTQDAASWLGSKRKGKKRRFHFRPEMRWLRYGILGVFVLCTILGLNQLTVLVAPYSTFGRTLNMIVNPLPLWGNIAVTAVMFILIMVLAWIGGRTWWCDSVCPVGTALGLVSRFAAFRPVIDTGKCRSCFACEKGCKASCIDIKNHRIDYSRCVDCFDCIGNCRFDAMHYKFAWGSRPSAPKETVDKGRRAALGTGAALAGAAVTTKVAATLGAVAAAAATASAQDGTTSTKKLDGGFAVVIPKQNPPRSVPLVPFGSRSVEDFYRRCTACQLCISACPNQVLRPSTDLEHFLKPVMGYDIGYCRPECTECSQVCPSGAILPITPQEKTSLHIGVASVERSLCVVETDGVSCGNCARHCPVGAILMVCKEPDNPFSLKIPAVDEARCIGCGACENLCPSRPVSAIRVNGREVHISEEA